MWRYAIRRLLQFVLVFFGTTAIIFATVFVLPGDPIRAMAGDHHLSASVVNALRARYHLNESLPLQYWDYISGVFRGDLGESFEGQSVMSIVRQAWPVTLRLGLTAWVVELILGVLLGVVAARRRGIPDRLILGLTTLIIAVPFFVVAYVLQIVVGVDWKVLPATGISEGWPRSYLLPGFVLGLYGIATIGRLTRASLLENLHADYVRTAVAKGLSPSRVVWKHALRNSLLPVITYLGLDLGYLLGGAVIVEGIFNIPGLGNAIFRGIQEQDGPIIVGISTLLVLLFLVVNLVVDLLYAVLNPRIRYG